MSESRTLNGAPDRRAAFAAGELVMLRDRRGRRYRLRLEAGKTFHLHMGMLDHDGIIGRPDGTYVLTTKGHRLLALRPTLLESVLELPRQSQVIYPKDLGAILVRGDIFPGADVVEVGLGSGVTAATILRAIGPTGTLVSYEVRESIVAAAKANIEELAPGCANHTIVVRDAYADGIDERNVDRIIVDVPEPWLLAGTVTEALHTGGIFLAFIPTALQVHQLGLQLIHDPHFHLVETVEVLERPWHVAERSVRPEHRMVGHTGFILTARRCETREEGEAGFGEVLEDPSEEMSGEPPEWPPAGGT